MDIGSPSHSTYDIKELRLQADLWLRERRRQLGLSQRVLAMLVGAGPYTVIGQLSGPRAYSAGTIRAMGVCLVHEPGGIRARDHVILRLRNQLAAVRRFHARGDGDSPRLPERGP